TFTSASPTAALLYPKILGAAAGVEAALLAQATPSHAIMHSRRWYWLAPPLGPARPLLNALGPASPHAGRSPPPTRPPPKGRPDPLVLEGHARRPADRPGRRRRQQPRDQPRRRRQPGSGVRRRPRRVPPVGGSERTCHDSCRTAQSCQLGRFARFVRLLRLHL